MANEFTCQFNRYNNNKVRCKHQECLKFVDIVNIGVKNLVENNYNISRLQLLITEISLQIQKVIDRVKESQSENDDIKEKNTVILMKLRLFITQILIHIQDKIDKIELSKTRYREIWLKILKMDEEFEKISLL